MRCVFKRWHSAQHVTTSQAIKVVRDSRCSDPRDMVYGLRAILPLGRLIVGYEKSVEEVYLDGVQAMINDGGHLNSMLEVIFFLGQAMLPRKFGEDGIVADDILTPKVHLDGRWLHHEEWGLILKPLTALIYHQFE
jgi:hypothetical protein